MSDSKPPEIPEAPRSPEPPEVEPPAPEPERSGGLGLADVRRIWPEVLERVKEMRRYPWMLISQNAQVMGVDASTLTLGFKNAGARDSFLTGGSEEILRQALIDLIGAEWKIDALIDQSAMPGDVPVRIDKPAVPPEPADPTGGSSERVASGAPDRPSGAAPETIAQARSNIAPTRPAGSAPTPPDPHEVEHGADRDDPDVVDDGLQGAELLERELGATVIEDIPHQ